MKWRSRAQELCGGESGHTRALDPRFVLSAVYRQATAVFFFSHGCNKSALLALGRARLVFREPHVLGSIFCIFHLGPILHEPTRFWKRFLNYKGPLLRFMMAECQCERLVFATRPAGHSGCFEDEWPKRWTLWHRIAHSQGVAAAAIRGASAHGLAFQYTGVTHHFAPVSIQFRVSKKHSI